MRKLIPASIALGFVAVLCWLFPAFHIRSLKSVRQAQETDRFNAADFVSRFWTGKLVPAAERAADAATVLDTIAAHPESVRDRFGRSVGVGSSYYLFLRGVGRVVSADEDKIGLSLRPDDDEAQIVIELGFVFGNAVRDATGLIEPGSYSNAQEFNGVSAALNSIVEANVLPQLRQIAKAGGRIQFAGCVEVGDEELDLKPLRLVPIFVKPD